MCSIDNIYKYAILTYNNIREDIMLSGSPHKITFRIISCVLSIMFLWAVLVPDYVLAMRALAIRSSQEIKAIEYELDPTATETTPASNKLTAITLAITAVISASLAFCNSVLKLLEPGPLQSQSKDWPTPYHVFG